MWPSNITTYPCYEVNEDLKEKLKKKFKVVQWLNPGLRLSTDSVR